MNGIGPTLRAFLEECDGSGTGNSFEQNREFLEKNKEFLRVIR
jgi:hypothetical protein